MQVVLGIVAVWLDLRRGDAAENGVFIHMFDLNRESNVPT